MAASRSELAAELRSRIQQELARREAGNDPIAFARLCGLEPDPWQQVALAGTRRLLLNCCRQSGKSTTAAVLGMHRAAYKPGSLVLLISPSLRQSGELLRKVAQAGRVSGVRPKSRSALTIELENGSRIVSLPASEDTIRGFSAVSLIIEDEAAYVPDALHNATTPMLATSRGDHVLMSTPNGRSGHFFEAWERGGDAWTRILLPASECPRIEPAWLTSEREALYRRGMGEYYRQEYEGAFIDAAGGRVYSGFDETRNVIDELPPAAPAFPWRKGLGLDFGIRDDNGLTLTYTRPHDRTLYIARSYRFHGGMRELGDEVLKLDKEVGGIDEFVGDTGGMGKAFQNDMVNHRNIPVRAASKTDKNGHIFLMNGALGDGRVKLVRDGTTQLREEWAALAWAEGGKKEADGTPNHASDSALYIWFAMSPHAERDETAAVRLTRDEQIHHEVTSHWDQVASDIEREKWEQREEERWENE